MASYTLLPSVIEVTRMRDVNQDNVVGAAVQAVEFHPVESTLLLTSSLDKTLRIYRLGGTSNKKLQSVYFEDMPMLRAEFTTEQQVLCAGRRKFFYLYDLARATMERVESNIGQNNISMESFALQHNSPSPLAAFMGNDGYVHLVSLKSRLSAGGLKMNGSSQCAAFTGNGNGLWTLSGDGIIYNWDLRMQSCVAMIKDEGATKATALGCSEDGKYLATGSDMGVVNMYRCDRLISSALSSAKLSGTCPVASSRPDKAIMNLTTAVNIIKYSLDGQLALIASEKKK